MSRVPPVGNGISYGVRPIGVRADPVAGDDVGAFVVEVASLDVDARESVARDDVADDLICLSPDDPDADRVAAALELGESPEIAIAEEICRPASGVEREADQVVLDRVADRGGAGNLDAGPVSCPR